MILLGLGGQRIAKIIAHRFQLLPITLQTLMGFSTGRVQKFTSI